MSGQLQAWARALGGEVSGGQVLCPGPGHSRQDRSLCVTPSATAPDGFLVHSFAGDDPIVCKDHVRPKIGQPEFKPNGHAKLAKKTDAATSSYFDYRDETGAILYQVERTDFSDGRKKTFCQRRPDGNGGWLWNLGGVHPVPYRLPELLEALAHGRTIVIAEGEPKVDLLWSWNVPATCNSGGAGKWRAQHSAYLSGADIVILPDNDRAGRLHLDAVAASLKEAGASVRVLDLPGLGPKGDVIDWAAAGGTVERLHDLIENEARPCEAATAWAPGEASNGKDNGEAPPLPELRVFNPADWEGKQAPERLWIVKDYIPARAVTLLYADGGTGKSYLKLQLAVARALAKEWIGLLPEPGRTLVCSSEDDADEMWRRIEKILPFYGARMADLGDIRLVDLAGESSVLGLLAKGIIEPTPMYQAIEKLIVDFKPRLVCLDVLADMFSGSENDRSQVTQFLGLLKRLCRDHDCAVLLLAQPSLSGIATDNGTSGSTGWGNSGRSRLWFKRVKDESGNEFNKDLRTFEGRKNNYGEIGGKFDVEWKGGLFRRVIGATGFDKMAAERKAEDDFLALLKKFDKQGRNVSHRNGPSYAPAAFASNAGEKAKFAAAMNRLFEAEKIKVEEHGPASRRRSRIVANG